ncbi:MAG: 1-acyl-sn-glycerol-3-phosphate acyltransferase [Actinobacteria bacterium]|nr:1-acyl-sn-glycerol-3-phosphate acyltransferase [Actinomycetota bacterium]MCB9411830.1 1-acyl-sn-glycerol-3-phosphate acyltransferase [Actinomycetota bacterium]
MRTGQRIVTALADVLTDAVFRSIEVRRRGAEPEGATLILASHGGGLADILLVIRAARGFPRFLARDVIWKVPLGSAVMNAVGAIPVHRRQDHHGEANNSGMFDATYEALAAGDVAAIYPEGESIPEPRLAPLRSGAARIAVGALRRGTDVTIAPMGLHFFDVSVLRSRAMVDCAEVFRISDVVDRIEFEGAVSETNRALVDAVTEVFADRLGAVSNHFDNWEELRRMEVAATIYLRQHRPEGAISYSEIASMAAQLAGATPALREEVDVAATGFVSELEILGLGPLDVPRGAMVNARLAREAAAVGLLAPAAVVGFAVNAVGIIGLRLISLSGIAPPTAATVKPAFAALAFPASWAALAVLGLRYRGWPTAAVLTAIGPASLGAAVRFGEQAQLLWRLGRALHRARGPLAEQVNASRNRVIEAVDAAIA